MNYTISDNMAGMKPSAIREIFKSLTDPSVISFAAGNPSPESFPVEAFGAISNEIFSSEVKSTTALQYSITEGYTPLREQIAARTKRIFNIGREFDDCIVTTGGQQAIDLSAKVLCNRGDTIICEDPSFIGALNAFRTYGVNLVGIPLENDGMNIELLEKALAENKNVRAIYVIPTFQNPAGITTCLEKRKQILALAKRYSVMIIEDNPYGELRFNGEDIPTIKSMDDDGIVIYCGSFSKILSAGMRIGFIIGPKPLLQKIVVAKQVNDVHSNIFFQMLCSEYIEKYNLDSHIQGIRTLYRRKCGLMLSELDKKLGGKIAYTRPDGGLFIWCTLPDGYITKDFVALAVEKKVAVVPGEAFLPDQQKVSNGFRLNYSTPSDEQIIKGVGLLAEAADALFERGAK